MNRDPINPQIVSAIVAAWLDAQDDTHEADILLEETLLAQGVLSPADAIESFEPSDSDTGIHMYLEDGERILIDHNGEIRSF